MADSVFSVAVRPRVSNLKLVSLLLSHSLAAIGCFYSGLSAYLVLALGYAVLVSLYSACRDEVRLNSPRRVVSLRGDGEVFELVLGDGSQHHGRRYGRCCVTTWLLVFSLRSQNGDAFHISIFYDSVSAQAFRRAAVALRFG
jgi:hypothetical protein